MSEPSKRPWKVYKHTIYMGGESAQAAYQLADAEGRGVLRIEGPKELCEANVRAILEGVNGREALVGLVRRFMGIINHNAPIASVLALLSAEEEGWSEMKEEEKAAKVSDGYKRLGKLMTEAYAAVGEEEKAGNSGQCANCFHRGDLEICAGTCPYDAGLHLPEDDAP